MKRASLYAGLFALVAAWALAGFGGNAFAVHMAAHMGVVAIAAPLIAIGLCGTRHDLSTRLTWVTPITASLIELIVVWFWHLPVMRALAETSPMAEILEQAMFLAGGLLLWLACLGAASRPGRLAGAAGLLFTSIHMTLLGVLLALAPRPLYGSADVMCLGVTLDAAADQQIGGVVMLLVGAASYLIGGVSLLYRLVTVEPDLAERVR